MEGWNFYIDCGKSKLSNDFEFLDWKNLIGSDKRGMIDLIHTIFNSRDYISTAIIKGRIISKLVPIWKHPPIQTTSKL